MGKNLISTRLAEEISLDSQNKSSTFAEKRYGRLEGIYRAGHFQSHEKTGLGEQMTLEEIQGTGPISGTITFLNGESFKKAAKYFQNKNKDLDNL